MARENKLELISKLRKDAVLFEKYEGEQKAKGARKKKGERLDVSKIPRKYRHKEVREKELVTNFYSGIFLHPSFGMELKVVIVERFNQKTKKIGQVLLFSSDVNLSWEKIVEYYSLRFQIEFNASGSQTTFRAGRFYESDGNRSGKCGQFIISDGQCECQIVSR